MTELVGKEHMRRISTIIAAAAIIASPLAVEQTAHAADVDNNTTIYLPAPAPRVQPLDCDGTTGRMGCGPGFFWRDGWHGWGCYPC
jgi:hypothetical protein